MWLTSGFLVACGPADDPSPGDGTPSAPSYAAPGPWHAGTAQVDVVGTDGLALPTQIWYPTLEEDGDAVSYDGLLAGEALPDAAPDCADPHPLLAFSHGSGGVRWQSPFFTEFLATHGYVVVAPDHVGNTFLDDSQDFPMLDVRRPRDVRDAVDWLLAASTDPADPYAGCVDPDDGYAIAGHSYGGYTTLALAGATVNDPAGGGALDLGDDRVWAAVALAPWDALGAITDGGSAIAVPALVLTGALDETTPLSQVQGLWDPMTVEPRYLGVFAEAGHYSFSPIACVLETGDGCGPEFIDPERFGPLVDTATAAFLEEVRGVPGAIDQLPLDAPEITWDTVPP